MVIFGREETDLITDEKKIGQIARDIAYYATEGGNNYAYYDAIKNRVQKQRSLDGETVEYEASATCTTMIRNGECFKQKGGHLFQGTRNVHSEGIRQAISTLE